MSFKWFFKQEEDNVKNLLQLVGEDTRPDSNYDQEQLKAGIQVELEHTINEEVAKVIAKTHLDEDKEYYVMLRELGL